MGTLNSRDLFKMLFLFLSLDVLAQKDSILNTNNNDATRAKTDSVFPAFIKIAANPQLKGTGSKYFLIGRNYRDEWTTAVEVPVLNLGEAYGGLVPTKQGGGKQTKSLRVEDHNGREWALRSVEKFPEKAVPAALRKTVAEKIVNDGISASYPYGVLSIGTLSRAANVLYLKDTLVYIADDPGLGEFRSKFKNTLVLMEEKEPSGFIRDDTRYKKEKTISTEELIYKLANSHNDRIDQQAILRARLLDNFIMDFDRHSNQWDWAGIDAGEEKTYYPVPIDRDQAFYRGDGRLLKFVSGKKMLPQIQGFREKAKDISTFNKAEQSFDRYFINGLSEEDWSRQIDEFLNSMTDGVIETALRKQPAEIRGFSAEKIIMTLKAKRQYFKEDMMEYYRFLSKTVSITGSNRREQFLLSANSGGVVTIRINTIDSAGNLSAKLYERVFDPAVTRELRIYGLEGDDKFVLEGDHSGIDIKIIGGPGNDEFVNNGNASKVFVYDVRFEQNTFTGNHIRKNISNGPQNNNYTRLDYRYDNAGVGLALEYTIGGLFLGPQVKIVNHGFRKDPYSSTHVISVTRAVDVSSYHVKYYADIIKVFGKTDLLLRNDGWLPSSRTFFFGIGNNTVFDKSKGIKYYFAYYNLVNLSLLFRNNIKPWIHFTYGPVFRHFKLKIKPNQNQHVSTLHPNDGDVKVDYIGKSFAGGQIGLEINTKNNEVVPTRGIKLNVFGRSLATLTRYSDNVSEAGGQLDLFTDFIAKRHVVIATSFGASHIAGKFDFEQAQYLGFRQNLRGFRIDRFAGRSRAYNNSELRLIKTDANLGLFRGSIGLFAFNDVARVWADNEKSDQWHDGYGWGIFLAPLNKVILTASLMYSKEEKNLLLVDIGFQF